MIAKKMKDNQFRFNILFSEKGPGFGGAVTGLSSLLKGLDREKFNPIVISSHNDYSTQKNIEAADATFIYVKNYRRKKIFDLLITKSSLLGINFKKIIMLALSLAEYLWKISYFMKVIRIIKKNKI